MDTLEKLEERINKALSLIEKLSNENRTLKAENEELKRELAVIRDEFAKLERAESERSAKAKAKLDGILEKLGALERI
jgi:FtsZ-binding cell division protein ZapB